MRVLNRGTRHRIEYHPAGINEIVQIFNLRREVWSDGIFDAAADGPNMGKYARACRCARSIVRKCRRGGAVKRFNRSVGEAAGQIGQEAAPGVAEANPRRAEVFEFGTEGSGRRRAGEECSIDGGLASDAGRAVVNFNPGDDVEDRKLVIKSGLDAADGS